LEAAESRQQSTTSVISREIVRVHARLYGRGPTRAKTYLHQEFVLCSLEDIFTPAETTLIAAGQEDLVRATRTAFQDATRDEFIAIVERATGRRVRSFSCQVDPRSNTAFEVFLLDEDHREPSAAPESDGAMPLGTAT
jgi:uncharacterized protein YbcI